MNYISITLVFLLVAVSFIAWVKDRGRNRELNTYRRVVKDLSDLVDRQDSILKRIRDARMLYTKHPAYVEVRRQIEGILGRGEIT